MTEIVTTPAFIGLVSIAVAIFFGIITAGRTAAGQFAQLSGKIGDTEKLLVVIRESVDKTFYLVSMQMSGRPGTVERHLPNIGKVLISAQPNPRANETYYNIETEMPVLKEAILLALTDDVEFQQHAADLLDGPAKLLVLSARHLRMRLPSNDPQKCTEYVTWFMRWLNSEYVSQADVSEFEKQILAQ